MSNVQILADKNDILFALRLSLIQDGILVWKTKDGKIIPLKDMETKHLLNVYRMLNNTSNNGFDAMDAGDLEAAMG